MAELGRVCVRARELLERQVCPQGMCTPSPETDAFIELYEMVCGSEGWPT